MKLQSIIYAVTVAVMASCSGGNASTDNNSAKPVKIDTVRLSAANTVLQFPGKVKAAEDANLSFKVAGRIKKIYVDEGAVVHKGQLLAELDDTDYRIQLDATEAEYAQVKAQAERVIALYNDNGTTPNDYDKAVYGLKQITAKLQAHREQLGYTKIYAPFAGKVQSKLFNDHETVAAGMPILMMIGGGQPEVEIFLPASDYMRRDRLAQYSCTFDIMPGVKYPLTVKHVAPQANANQLYAMRLRIAAPAGSVMPVPGMSTMVTAAVGGGDDKMVSLVVPSGAVLKADGREWVYVVDAKRGTISRREVKLVQLLSNESSIVASSALNVGDIVVASGTRSLHDGDEITIVNEFTKTNVGGLL